MILNPILIPTLLGIGVVCFVFLIFFLTKSAIEHRMLIGRIKHNNRSLLAQENIGIVSLINKPQKHSMRFFTNIAKVFGDIAKPKSEEDFSRLQKDLLNIGYKNVNAAKIYLGIKAVCTISLPAVIFFFKHLLPISISIKPLNTIGLCVFLAAVGYYLPGVWLRAKIAKRKESILRGFPDALDMMVVCVEAGMGLDAAMDRVAEEMNLSNEIISEEFKRYNREIKMGKTRRNALKNLAHRTSVEDVDSFVTLLIQTDKFGTSIAKALKTHADFMRTQRFQRAEEKAAKLAVKLLFPLIFCIFPSIFVVILGPALIQAYRTFNN